MVLRWFLAAQPPFLPTSSLFTHQIHDNCRAFELGNAKLILRPILNNSGSPKQKAANLWPPCRATGLWFPNLSLNAPDQFTRECIGLMANRRSTEHFAATNASRARTEPRQWFASPSYATLDD
jgi:hypothetical protein